MNDNRINGKIKMPLLKFAPAFVAGAFLIVAALQGFASPAPVAAQADTTAPTVSSIAITSDPDDDIYEDVPYRARGSTWNVRPSGIYGIGDDIEVTVTFNEDVTVTGTPKLDLDIGGSSKAAEYLKAEDGAVVFRYTVAEWDSDTNGVAIDANRLRLNGGSIKDGAGNDADLSHDALASQANHEVDGIRPRISLKFAPTASRSGPRRPHPAGDVIFGPNRFTVRGSRLLKCHRSSSADAGFRRPTEGCRVEELPRIRRVVLVRRTGGGPGQRRGCH